MFGQSAPATIPLAVLEAVLAGLPPKIDMATAGLTDERRGAFFVDAVLAIGGQLATWPAGANADSLWNALATATVQAQDRFSYGLQQGAMLASMNNFLFKGFAPTMQKLATLQPGLKSAISPGVDAFLAAATGNSARIQALQTLKANLQ